MSFRVGSGNLNRVGLKPLDLATWRLTVANTGAFGIFTTSGGAIQRNRPALAQAFKENGANGAAP